MTRKMENERRVKIKELEEEVINSVKSARMILR